MKAIALSTGNTDELISVQLPSGETTQAVAATTIIDRDVFLLKEGDRYYVWNETPALTVLEHNEADYRRVKPPVEVPTTILPFQVLYVPNVGLGGDRNQVALQPSALSLQPSIGGINNLGNQEYKAVWFESNGIVVDNNGAIALLGIPAGLGESDYRWLGFGKLTTGILRPEPEEDLTIIEDEGFSPPSIIQTPLSLSELDDPILYYLLPPAYLPLPEYNRLIDYPAFSEPSYTLREGTFKTAQIEEDYSYQEDREWYYQNTFSGNSDTPAPSVFSLNVVCNFVTSGASEERIFDRFTEFNHHQQINKTNNKSNVVYWNNERFEGDRSQVYSSDFSYSRSSAAFLSAAYFNCVNLSNTGNPAFDSYAWQSGGTYTFWSGEDILISHNISHSITETFDRPFISEPLTHTFDFSETSTEETEYNVPNESWITVTGFSSGYQFPVDGTEIYTLTRTISESISAPEPLLIDGTGGEGIYKQLDSNVVREIETIRDATITRFLANNTHDFPVFSNYERVEIVSKTELLSLKSRFESITTDITINNSFLFKIALAEPPMLEEGITLANADNSSFFSELVEYATYYKKTSVFSSAGINISDIYSEQEFQPIPIWDNLIGRAVFVLIDGFRYQAQINSYSSTETSVEAEVLREIIGVALEVDLDSAIAYPKGLVGANEIWIYPQDNCSVLLQHILESENRNYCNLVEGVVYFAKSVAEDLGLSTQEAEVYSILGDKIVQENSISGAFIPVTGTSDVLGISYYPQ